MLPIRKSQFNVLDNDTPMSKSGKKAKA